ncbi:MAG: hypothetical protein QXQ53_04910, partial [Candidatus Methanosuratincola sp.]
VLHPGAGDVPLASIVHEYEATPDGTRMRSTFILPALVPAELLEALRKHNIGEMAQFSVFLPELYRQKAGK